MSPADTHGESWGVTVNVVGSPVQVGIDFGSIDASFPGLSGDGLAHAVAAVVCHETDHANGSPFDPDNPPPDPDCGNICEEMDAAASGAFACCYLALETGDWLTWCELFGSGRDAYDAASADLAFMCGGSCPGGGAPPAFPECPGCPGY